MTHEIVPPRSINDWERRTLERLLSSDFPGAKELRLQLPHVRVSEEYPIGDPTVIFLVDQNAAPVASVDGRVPVEAEGDDDDGMPVFALLHVIDGYLWELEFWRGDGDVIQRLPDPTSLKITARTATP